MSTRKRAGKSKAVGFLEDITSGALNLAELLSAIRQGEEMSHAAFAAKLGISRSHLCDIEKGRKAVSLPRAVEFAEILGYSKDQFTRLALQTQVNEAGLPYKVRIDAA
jgi:antitoxin HigA-1